MDSQAPIIFLMTGYSDFPASEAYNLGVEGFTSKPFNLETILDDLARILTPATDRWRQTFTPDNLIKIKTNQTPDEALAKKSIYLGRGEIKYLLGNSSMERKIDTASKIRSGFRIF